MIRSKAFAVTCASALFLSVASVDGFALAVSNGEVVTVNSQLTEDVTVAAGGTLRVVEGAVIDGAITVSGSLIVTGGTLATNTDTHNIKLEDSSSAEISGGTFNTNNFYVKDDAALTVSGGVWNNDNFYIQGNARTNFSGGSFNGDTYYFQGFGGGSLSSISGGEFRLTGGLYSQGDGQVTITGGVFNDDAGGELRVTGSSSMEIRGGSFNLPIQIRQHGQLSIFGHTAFNYPFGSYEDGSDLDGATLTGRLFSGDTFSSTIAIDEDGSGLVAKVTLVNLFNSALVVPVPTLPLFGLGILVSLLGLFGLRKLRQ
ncbi:hypothetical protein N9Y37_03390 [Luminiphilus sp.]|nr:hypothetical protein [Luminiphilus sp.]